MMHYLAHDCVLLRKATLLGVNRNIVSFNGRSDPSGIDKHRICKIYSNCPKFQECSDALCQAICFLSGTPSYQALMKKCTALGCDLLMRDSHA